VQFVRPSTNILRKLVLERDGGIPEVVEKCILANEAIFTDRRWTQHEVWNMGFLDEVCHVWCADGTVALVDALIDVGLATSKREAREFINNNAVRVNGAVVTDPKHQLIPEGDGGGFIVRKGKQQSAIIFLGSA
jgi:tyrosyl-tRNA synthetase